MAITSERAEVLLNYINENQDERLELFELDADEAIGKINADGLDITAEEFEEFAEAIEQAIANSSEEMDESSLDNVAGGSVASAIYSIVYALIKRRSGAHGGGGRRL